MHTTVVVKKRKERNPNCPNCLRKLKLNGRKRKRNKSIFTAALAFYSIFLMKVALLVVVV